MNSSHLHLEQLSRQLLIPIHETQTTFCTQYQAELPLFITDELAGCPVDELYPEVAFHLDLCSTCRQEYIELAELTTTAMYGEDVA